MIYFLLLTWKEESWMLVTDSIYPPCTKVRELTQHKYSQERFNLAEKKPSIPKGHHVGSTFPLLWEKACQSPLQQGSSCCVEWYPPRENSFSYAPMQLLHFTEYPLSPLTPFLVTTPWLCSCISNTCSKYLSPCYIISSPADYHTISVKSSATQTPSNGL